MFILLLTYENSKYSPVSGDCCGISFTCTVCLCTVNVPESLTYIQILLYLIYSSMLKLHVSTGLLCLSADFSKNIVNIVH